MTTCSTPAPRAPRLSSLAVSACAALALASPLAQASCGAAFCTLLNDRFALGTADHLGWSGDLRLEMLTQDQLRSGTRNVPRDEVTDAEELGRRTRNRTLRLTLDYAWGPQWSVSLRVPIQDVDHLRDVFEDGEAGQVTHRYTRLGDVQVLGRWQITSAAEADTRWALVGGLKLPSGSSTVANAEGERADRALQPGSGTTDLVLGLAARHLLGMADALNLQATLTLPLNTHQAFRPGRRAEVSLGWSHALNPQWTGVLQLNATERGRDSGAQAEAEDSGSTTLMFSPGIAWAAGDQSTVYLTWQKPIVQRVNGLQLVARQGWALGWTQAF